MKKDIIKEYINGEIIIVWKLGICVYVVICIGLGNVFDFKKCFWINVEGVMIVEIVV